MGEYIDIKYFLVKHRTENISLEETLNSIDEYIKENGFYTVDDIKESFEQGERNGENNIKSDDTIIERYRNDETIDNFINYISINGFFTKTDITNVYDVGKRNGDNKKLNGDILRDLFITHFRQYLIYNYDEV